jgi:excinuclease ABC subunit C
VYFHKDAKGQIIYVGKAAVLRNRVRQYFQASPATVTPRPNLLVGEIADTDWQVVDSEVEALFLEAEMIRRYMPRYNIHAARRQGDDVLAHQLSKTSFRTITYTRVEPLDDGADYYGPFLSAFALRRALKYLRKGFPFSTHSVLPKRACSAIPLSDLCPGPETGELDSKVYKTNLKKLVRVVLGPAQRSDCRVRARHEALSPKTRSSKKPQTARNQMFTLKRLDQQVIFSDKEFQDIAKDHALVDLTSLLGPAASRHAASKALISVT